MAKARQELHLDLAPDRVAEIAQRVVTDLGWEVSRDESGRLIADEDAAKLHCHCSPLHAELDLKTTESPGTTLTIKGSVHGWGPVASEHVRRQTDLLTRRLGLEAIEAMRAAGSERR